MKRNQFKIIAIAALFFTLNAHAQKDSSGIYKTAEDFQNRKLSYAINYKTEKHRINDNLLFNESGIKVRHQGMLYSMKKKETYGYRDTKGIDYRFMDNKAYKILNSNRSLNLYVFQSLSNPNKGTAVYIPRYYFSKDLTSAPQSLTKENVKSAYPNNHKFHDAIDASFTDDKELAQYDSFHKMYKLNHILEMNSK